MLTGVTREKPLRVFVCLAVSLETGEGKGEKREEEGKGRER